MDTWIQTKTGKKFYPLKPSIDDICIEDIAYSLSNLCRYNGHCNKFYSVAEHSVYTSQYVSSEFALEGLLHDAAEAYIGDIASPVKKIIPDVKKIENKILKCVSKKFKLKYPFHKSVKEIDLRLLTTEAWQIMSPQVEAWPQLTEPALNLNIKCLKSFYAYHIFLKRYEMLKRV